MTHKSSLKRLNARGAPLQPGLIRNFLFLQATLKRVKTLIRCTAGTEVV